MNIKVIRVKNLLSSSNRMQTMASGVQYYFGESLEDRIMKLRNYPIWSVISLSISSIPVNQNI